jgi:hypothetical protein
MATSTGFDYFGICDNMSDCPARIPSYKNGVVTQTRCNKPTAEGSDCCYSCTKRRGDHYALWENGEYRVTKLAKVGKIGWHGIRGGLFPWYSLMVKDDGTRRNRDEFSEPMQYAA